MVSVVVFYFSISLYSSLLAYMARVEVIKYCTSFFSASAYATVFISLLCYCVIWRCIFYVGICCLLSWADSRHLSVCMVIGLFVTSSYLIYMMFYFFFY